MKINHLKVDILFPLLFLRRFQQYSNNLYIIRMSLWNRMTWDYQVGYCKFLGFTLRTWDDYLQQNNLTDLVDFQIGF